MRDQSRNSSTVYQFLFFILFWRTQIKRGDEVIKFSLCAERDLKKCGQQKEKKKSNDPLDLHRKYLECSKPRRKIIWEYSTTRMATFFAKNTIPWISENVNDSGGKIHLFSMVQSGRSVSSRVTFLCLKCLLKDVFIVVFQINMQ